MLFPEAMETLGRQRLQTMDEGYFKYGSLTFEIEKSASYPGATYVPRRRPSPPRAPLHGPMKSTMEVPPLELPKIPRKRGRSFTGSTASLGEERSTSPDVVPVPSTTLTNDDYSLDLLGDADLGGEHDGEEDDEEDAYGEEEALVFGFVEEKTQAQDDVVHDFQMQLTGFDTSEGYDIPEAMPQAHPHSVQKARAVSQFSGEDQHRARLSDQKNQRSASDGTSSGSLLKVGFNERAAPVLGASPVLLSALQQVAAEFDERLRRGTL